MVSEMGTRIIKLLPGGLTIDDGELENGSGLNMFVKAELRCRGIAIVLMCKMLRDDRKYASQCAVLTTNHARAILYPVVGYSTLETLLAYTPKKT